MAERSEDENEMLERLEHLSDEDLGRQPTVVNWCLPPGVDSTIVDAAMQALLRGDFSAVPKWAKVETLRSLGVAADEEDAELDELFAKVLFAPPSGDRS